MLIQTNGLRLAYPAYAGALLEAGLTAVRLNLKSADPALADQLSGLPGAHALLDRALASLAPLPRPRRRRAADTLHPARPRRRPRPLRLPGRPLFLSGCSRPTTAKTPPSASRSPPRRAHLAWPRPPPSPGSGAFLSESLHTPWLHPPPTSGPCSAPLPPGGSWWSTPQSPLLPRRLAHRGRGLLPRLRPLLAAALVPRPPPQLPGHPWRERVQARRVTAAPRRGPLTRRTRRAHP